MNALLLITAFLTAATIHEIVQAVANHVKAKDALKLLTARKEAAEAEARRIEAEEHDKTLDNAIAERRGELADKIAAMNEEQLAAYNESLAELRKPAIQYYPVPYWTLVNPQQSIMQWRGF